MSDLPQLGQLLPQEERRRDAVHIAIAPVTAHEPLMPGQHVGFVLPNNTDAVGVTATPIGIIDPFLQHKVEVGDRVWIFLYPNTVTSLRHVWSHPAYSAKMDSILAKAKENR